MPASERPRRGRLWFAATALLIGACGKADNASAPSPAVVAAAAEVKKRAAACQRTRGESVERYNALMSQAKYSEAASSFGDCAKINDAADLRALIAEAEGKRYAAIATDTRLPATQRLYALRSLETANPAAFAAHSKLLPQLEKASAQQQAAEEKRQAELERRRRKSEGVRLGMSAEEVMQSSWGRPQKINRTTTKHGTHEQWVYPGGYLYLEDGILTSVQN